MISNKINLETDFMKHKHFKLLTNDLNNEQIKALSHKEGPLIIVASPGSGKTLTLTYKILYLLIRGVKSENIIAITFTRKAADEMKNRIENIASSDLLKNITISNFHQLCLKILRANHKELGFSYQFSVLGSNEQKKLILDCLNKLQLEHNINFNNIDSQLEQLGISKSNDYINIYEDYYVDDSLSKNYEYGYKGEKIYYKTLKRINTRLITKLVSFIRTAKLNGKTPNDFSGNYRLIYNEYLNSLKNTSTIDFSDMIPLVLLLFKQKDKIKEYYQNKYKYILCDEFQDVSLEQFDLLQVLSQSNKNIVVCGDDDQSIFGWRCKGITNCFYKFKQNYPEFKKIVLNQTYRSSKNIVKAYTSLIAYNRLRVKKDVWTNNIEGVKIKLLVSKNTNNEHKIIYEELIKLHEEHKIPYNKIAILGRTKNELNNLYFYFKNLSIPIINSTINVFWRKSKEVFDILAYMKLIISNQSNSSFLRVINKPKRNIGKNTIENIKEYAILKKKPIFLYAQDYILIHELTKKCKKNILAFILLIKNMRKNVEKKNILSIINMILDKTEYKQIKNINLANIDFLLNTAIEFDKESKKVGYKGKISDFIKHIESKRNISNFIVQNRRDVILTTIHQAKGLEWDVVIIKSFNEGTLPLPVFNIENKRKNDHYHESINEERRIAYVAMSRARKRLILSFKLKDVYGNQLIPSRFLNEIPKELFEGKNG